MGNKKLIGQGIFLLLILLSAYFGYRFLSGGATTPVEVSKETTPGYEVLLLLGKLKSINFDGTLLDNPGFQTLEEQTTVVINKPPQGRPNPFLPIGVDDLSGQDTGNDESESPADETGANPEVLPFPPTSE